MKNTSKADPIPPIVSLMVRENDCADHPGSPWITLNVNGFTILSTCCAGLETMARAMRGSDMVRYGTLAKRVNTPPDAPSSPTDLDGKVYHNDPQKCRCFHWARVDDAADFHSHHPACPFAGWNTSGDALSARLEAVEDRLATLELLMVKDCATVRNEGWSADYPVEGWSETRITRMFSLLHHIDYLLSNLASVTRS